MDSNFMKEFFTCNQPIASQAVANGFIEVGSRIFEFLGVTDVVRFSTCSRITSSIMLQSSAFNIIANSGSDKLSLGNLRIAIQEDMNLAKFRAIVSRFRSCSVATLRVGSSANELTLDLGNVETSTTCDVKIDRDELAFLAAEPRIEKALERVSYDEYDDFNPRHPSPKDKVHRRGDSYFNSDIEACATEALKAFDLQNLSSKDLENMAIQQAKERNHF